jgi:hypothetical protein
MCLVLKTTVEWHKDVTPLFKVIRGEVTLGSTDESQEDKFN